jgi:hypothetical protein
LSSDPHPDTGRRISADRQHWRLRRLERDPGEGSPQCRAASRCR